MAVFKHPMDFLRHLSDTETAGFAGFDPIMDINIRQPFESKQRNFVRNSSDALYPRKIHWTFQRNLYQGFQRNLCQRFQRNIHRR